ncbi:DUF6093 family protein [Rothia sp. AR01]|uniref:DUF6093 family protein n=1 Tax=Rothia santali TaxID=2949643 RepID=A0A9X2KIN8_9MICC|nr:DUF6093 family protein [Rothia santali]MCP3426024.1 DUF6093 family protein [Rothia santali]
MGALDPDRPLIPPGWHEHHRPVAEAAFTARCRIYHRVLDPPVGFEREDWDLVAEGAPCRVQQLNSGAADLGIAAGQIVGAKLYRISLPLEWAHEITGGAASAQIVITDTPRYDPQLTGRRFDVVHVLQGTDLWQRDLLCVDVETQNGAMDYGD